MPERPSRRHETKGQPAGPKSMLRLRTTIRTTRKKTMLAHAASTIHLAAMPMPSTVPIATRESIDALNDLLWMWTMQRKEERRMEKIGKMSIIPMRDWMKNIPSKQTSVAAAIANRRLGHLGRATRDLGRTQNVPKRQE